MSRPMLILFLSLSTGLMAHDLSDYVAEGAKAEKVAGDCRFTEGPAFSPDGYLLFSDIPASRILRLKDDKSTVEFLRPSGKANGLMFDATGALYVCQGGDRRLVRIDPGKTDKPVVLADEFDGRKLNSPNDLALDAHGGLYFTDPRYGSADDLEQLVMGVYYIAEDGKVTRVIDKLVRPNGVLVSAKGDRLFVAEPNKREIHRYPILAPGKLGEGKVIFTGDPELDGGGPDGMALDVDGNIYATYKGITVLHEDGEVIGRIPVPERPSNCTFGGKDGKTLYITARSSLYSVAMKIAGAPLRKSGPGGASTATVKLGDLSLDVPSRWKQTKPKSRMRVGQFDVPAAKGDKVGGEVAVFSFGGGGGVDANVRRWIGQFAEEGRKGKVSSGKCEQGEYVVVDIQGTYMASVGPPIQGKKEARPGWRVVNVILVLEGEKLYFLKLAGPYKTSTSALEELRASFGAVSDEKTREIE